MGETREERLKRLEAEEKASAERFAARMERIKAMVAQLGGTIEENFWSGVTFELDGKRYRLAEEDSDKPE